MFSEQPFFVSGFVLQSGEAFLTLSKFRKSLNESCYRFTGVRAVSKMASAEMLRMTLSVFPLRGSSVHGRDTQVKHKNYCSSRILDRQIGVAQAGYFLCQKQTMATEKRKIEA